MLIIRDYLCVIHSNKVSRQLPTSPKKGVITETAVASSSPRRSWRSMSWIPSNHLGHHTVWLPKSGESDQSKAIKCVRHCRIVNRFRNQISPLLFLHLSFREVYNFPVATSTSTFVKHAHKLYHLLLRVVVRGIAVKYLEWCPVQCVLYGW